MTTRTCSTAAALLASTLGAALASGAALAQGADTSAWKCELCPFAAGHEGSATAGVTTVDEDAAYLGDATGYDESGAYGNVDALGSYTGDDYFARWKVDDLLLDSRALRMDGRSPGTFQYRLEYAQIPRRTFITTRSIFRDPGDALLALPEGWVTAPQTTAFTTLEDSLVDRDIASDRTNWLVGGDYRLSQHFSASLDYRRREQDGTRILGGSAYTTASLLPAPFDYATDEVEASLDYAARRAYVSVGWYLSDFSNDNLGLTWETPFTAFPGAETPALAQAPENRFQQVSVRGGYAFDRFDTTLGASLAVGEITQDSAFLAYTTNTMLSADPLPQSSLDGSVDVTNYALTASLRPLPRARVRLSYRYDERDNSTNRFAWNRVIVDSFASGASELNTPYSFERTVLNARANYKLSPELTLEGGVERRELERDFREVAEQTEDTGWLGLRWQPLDLLALDLRGGTQKRDIDRYDETIAVALDQNPLLRKYDLAYRYREFGELTVSLVPAAWPIALTFEGRWADDSYTQSRLGMIAGEELDLAADLTWTVSETVSGWLNLGYDTIESLQRGSESFAEPDWTADWEDSFTSVGAGVRIRGIADKADLQVDFRTSDSTSAIAMDAAAAGADEFPDLENSWSQLRVSVDYAWSERLMLELELTWQQFESDDWMLEGVGPASIPTVLSLGAMPYDEEQLLIGIGFRYSIAASRESNTGDN